MKYGVVVVLLIASAMAQDKLTVKQCRADLDKWVPMFKAMYAAPECQGDGGPNCPFVDPIRTLQSAQLVNIATEAEECTKLDPKKKNHFIMSGSPRERKMSWSCGWRTFWSRRIRGRSTNYGKRSAELPRQREKKEQC